MSSPQTSTAPRFGPYELERRIGAGGMAETFLAVRRGPGAFEQRVCLKRILPAFEEDAEFVRLFLEEARVSAQLRHTNIVQVLDFGVVEGSHFLALELIEGMDMRGVLTELRRGGENMTSGLVTFVASELAAALDFAHAAGPDGSVKGVVHRDISPSNVLLSTAGEVKLTDFGIAKAMNTTHVTRSGTVKGKVPYMAPEYALNGEFDARSDLFSLGVTLYESLVGRRPFDGVTELDTMRRIQEGRFVPVREAAPGTPEALADAIDRLLQPNPSDRHVNAGALLDALVDVAPPPTARRILGNLVRRCREQKDGRARPAPLPPPAQMAVAPPSAETRTREPTAATEPDPTPPAAPAPTPAPAPPIPHAVAAPAHALAAPIAEPHDQTLPGARRVGPIAIALASVALLAALGVAALVIARAGDDEVGNEATASAAPPPASTSPEPAAPGPPPAIETERVAAETETDEAPEPPIVDPPAEPEAQAAAEESASEREPGDRDRRPAARTARLRVTVTPWGRVWVDGAFMGRAPVDVQVTPGPHVVTAGFEEPTARKRVRATANRTTRVDIELATP